MKLGKEVYQALEDIVGPEYITQEPVILDTYNQVWGNKFFFDEKHSTRPAAVLLPATTQEVQEIVIPAEFHGPQAPIGILEGQAEDGHKILFG